MSSVPLPLLQELDRSRDETLRYFALDERNLARTYGPDKWSVRFILHHLADSETVLYERIRRILSEPRGVRTLKQEFDKVASHNEHHLGQIRLALGMP